MSHSAARWRLGRVLHHASMAGRSWRFAPHAITPTCCGIANPRSGGRDLRGATTANVLDEKQNGAPPKITALNGSESLTTMTIGVSGVGYVPLLTSAYLPRPMRSVPIIAGRLRDLHGRDARNRALAKAA